MEYIEFMITILTIEVSFLVGIKIGDLINGN